MPPLAEDLSEAGLTRRSLTPERPATTYVLSFDTGESVVVRGNGLVGRRPQARAGEPEAIHLVPITDSALSVSKTHLAFGLAGGDLWVSDRGSTNGTVVVRADGSEQDATAGKAVIVRSGDRVRFGDRSFRVREG
jgi:pSer/pThr/pTyr-binding forkhead associated (FHA) protein